LQALFVPASARVLFAAVVRSRPPKGIGNGNYGDLDEGPRLTNWT